MTFNKNLPLNEVLHHLIWNKGAGEGLVILLTAAILSVDSHLATDKQTR